MARPVYTYSGGTPPDPDMAPYSGQPCNLIRRLSVPDEVDVEVGDVYEVRFSDGTTRDVFGDEISFSPSA